MFIIVFVILCAAVSIPGMEIINMPKDENLNLIPQSNTTYNVADSTSTSVNQRTITSGTEKETVIISVYYESLCPDCREFFVTQLLPVVARLFHNINVHLVPYGHAKSNHLANGTIEFECQHGPAECYGNIVHACAIQKLVQPPWSASLFASCLMAQSGKGSDDAALADCGQLLSVPAGSISECAKGPEGIRLLDKYGNETKKYSREAVPFVLLNGSSDNQDEVVENLLSSVCKLFHTRPPGCGKNNDTTP